MTQITTVAPLFNPNAIQSITQQLATHKENEMAKKARNARNRNIDAKEVETRNAIANAAHPIVEEAAGEQPIVDTPKTPKAAKTPKIAFASLVASIPEAPTPRKGQALKVVNALNALSAPYSLPLDELAMAVHARMIEDGVAYNVKAGQGDAVGSITYHIRQLAKQPSTGLTISKDATV